MDDTHQSRTSDAAAAATRKRRSSILKSQRPPRTPFSDLEFNVATPTDTTKNRRVSFSKRTGVAEFATNEATTTWKNFYEEHNKSLELSGNDFGASSKQPIGHIGKRIFDQQFEVEAIEITDVLNPGEHIINCSMNNVNFTHQIASLECTEDDRKLTAPQNNFELNTFTDHQSKLFGDDLAIQSMGEFTDRIDINFSNVPNISSNDKDDLDEIEKNLERDQNNSARNRQSRNRNFSEYIELNFDTTHVAIRNEESDMSITDTVHSPKVQDVSKNFSIEKKSNSSTSKDWVTDKENIAMNPYVAPQESANFAINEEPDKVLVFDGKRLTIQTEKRKSKVNDKNNLRESCLPENVENPQRKTIVLNVNDDLPNYINNSSGTSLSKQRHSVNFNDGDLSMTQALIGKIEQNSNRRTMIFNDDIGDISMTQAIPNNILLAEKTETDKRRTIVFENDTGDVSITRVLPNTILSNSDKIPERRKTIVYENETGDISMTQAVPTNIIFDKAKDVPERRKTILYDNNDGNISITQALPSHIIAPDIVRNSEKRRTIIYENDMDISITQAIPTNILIAKKPVADIAKAANDREKRNTIVFDDNFGDLSITKAVPQNLFLPEKTENKQRRTIVFDTESDISITQAVSNDFMILDNRDSNATVYGNDVGNISVTQAIPTNILLSENAPYRRRTVVFENETADLSITQAVTKNRLLSGFTDTCEKLPDIDDNNMSITEVQHTVDTNKRKTIVYENDDADVSMTQAIPANIIFNDEAHREDKRKAIVYEVNSADISMTQALPTNVFLLEGITEDAENLPENKTEETKLDPIILHNEDVLMADSIPKKSRESTSHKRKSVTFNDINEVSVIELPNDIVPEKRKSVVNDSGKTNLSITNPIPTAITSLQNEVDKPDSNKCGVDPSNVDLDFIIYQTDTTHDVKKLHKTIDQSNAVTEESNIDDNKPTAVKNVVESSESEVSTATSSQTQLLILDAGKLDEVENKVSVELKKSIIFADEGLKSEDDTEVLSQPKELVLDGLLDMTSTESLDGGKEDKKFKVTLKSDQTAKDTGNTSSDSLFYITRDSDEDGHIDKCVEKDNDGLKVTKSEEDVVIEKSLVPLSHDYNKGGKSRVVAELKNKLVKLKSAISGSKYNTPTSKHEKILSFDLNKDTLKQKDKQKNIENANDTNELLDMLSELTDNSANIEMEAETSIINPSIPVKDSKTIEKHVESPLSLHNAIEYESEPNIAKDHIPFETEKRIEPVMGKGLLALEDKSCVDPVSAKASIESKSVIIEPRRLSFAPSRQSIALSREEMMNNISMAQAALQLSRDDMDVTEDIEDTANDSTIEHHSSHKSMSNEVVKTLNFEEDETATEISLKPEIKPSPLKKTTFGETSIIKDRKSKVVPIPGYLNDISNGIKELMDDLVKPMADVLPFETIGVDKSIKKITSTCSTQIQANLVTSSQIDICGELMSESKIDVKKMESLASEIAILGNRAVAHALKNPIQCVSSDMSMKSSEVEVPRGREHTVRISPQRARHDRSPQRVIVFDHYNPLNNVLLGPMDYNDAHRYQPRNSSDKLPAIPRYDSAQISVNEDEVYSDVNRISHHYNVESRLSIKHSVQQAGDAGSEKAVDAQSMLSSESKPMSVDQSIDARVVIVQDTEVNTVIAMKGNNELLDASSSLTLVDDALARSSFDINLDSTVSSRDPSVKGKSGPVKVIYKTKKQELSSEKQDSDFTSNDDFKTEKNVVKAKKRVSSPPKRDKKKLTFDLTPRPMNKIQKRSNSPRRTISPDKANKIPAERDETEPTKCILKTKVKDDTDVSPESSKHVITKKSPRKGKTSPKGRKGPTVTVQQLITEYNIETNIDQSTLNKQILQALNDPKSGSSTEPTTVSHSDDETKSLEMVSSFASSKNEYHTIPSITSESLSSESRHRAMKVGFVSDPSSKELIDDCDSSANVVAKIDMLPFMGSEMCEWEATSGDTWTFRLLHGRLRVTVRLAHRYDNATRTRVRADTAVLAVGLETVHQDKKNPIASICVRFASDAMRYYIGRGCGRAGDVPALLRRCSAVARVALRWGRAMHDAHMHLAYTLAPTGHLALKVANVPLRAVWEVTMRLELVVEDASSAPWPRAADVRVECVVSGASGTTGTAEVSAARIAALLAPLPHHWGHAPAAVWKIFKYLKHKKRDDATLLGF